MNEVRTGYLDPRGGIAITAQDSKVVVTRYLGRTGPIAPWNGRSRNIRHPRDLGVLETNPISSSRNVLDFAI